MAKSLSVSHSLSVPFSVLDNLQANINIKLVFECGVSQDCSNGAQCINNLCCHVDKLVFGAALCPTLNDLQRCGGYQRTTGGFGHAAWSPPETDIPAGLKCGC